MKGRIEKASFNPLIYKNLNFYFLNTRRHTRLTPSTSLNSSPIIVNQKEHVLQPQRRWYGEVALGKLFSPFAELYMTSLTKIYIQMGISSEIQT